MVRLRPEKSEINIHVVNQEVSSYIQMKLMKSYGGRSVNDPNPIRFFSSAN